MSPDTLTTLTPEATAAPAPAETASSPNRAEKDLAVKIDAFNVLKPEEGINALANLDFKTDEAASPPADATASETPEAKPTEKVIETPDTVAETPTKEPESTEPVDPDAELNEGEQTLAEAKMDDVQKRMTLILTNPKTTEASRQAIRESAALLGLNLGEKVSEKKKFTKKEWAMILLIGTLLAATMPVVAGAASAKL